VAPVVGVPVVDGVVTGAGVPVPVALADGEGVLVPVPGLAGAVGEGVFVAVGVTLGLGALVGVTLGLGALVGVTLGLGAPVGATAAARCAPVDWLVPGSVAAAPPVAESMAVAAERLGWLPVSPGWLLIAGPPTGTEPRIGNGPSRPSSRATSPASKPSGTGTATGTGGSVGGLTAGCAAEAGAEMAISDAFAASAGAATQAALAKTLAAATPPRMIRRFLTARSFPDRAGALITVINGRTRFVITRLLSEVTSDLRLLGVREVNPGKFATPHATVVTGWGSGPTLAVPAAGWGYEGREAVTCARYRGALKQQKVRPVPGGRYVAAPCPSTSKRHRPPPVPHRLVR
jgi:hypothetical protein